MVSLTETERAVLGATARGPEDLEHIYERLHAPPRGMPLSEAADAVRSLVEKGLLAPRPSGDSPPPEDLSRVWKSRFEPTPEAREALDGDRPGPPPGWPKGRVYPGMFKGLIPEISREEIDELRRETWAEFPRDAPS